MIFNEVIVYLKLPLIKIRFKFVCLWTSEMPENFS